MKQTDRPFPFLLRILSTPTFSFFFLAPNPFSFTIHFHLFRFVSSSIVIYRHPFFHLFSFSFPFPFSPFTTPLALLVPSLVPRREGLYLTTANRQHDHRSVCVYPRTPIHTCSCLLTMYICLLFSYRPLCLVVKTYHTISVPPFSFPLRRI